jgi:hypothetical protein
VPRWSWSWKRAAVSKALARLAELLNSNDQEGLIFKEQSAPVDTLAAAFELLNHYQWHRLMPLRLDEEYADVVIAEVHRRGGPKEAARWKSEVSRRSDRPAG